VLAWFFLLWSVSNLFFFRWEHRRLHMVATVGLMAVLARYMDISSLLGDVSSTLQFFTSWPPFHIFLRTCNQLHMLYPFFLMVLNKHVYMRSFCTPAQVSTCCMSLYVHAYFQILFLSLALSIALSCAYEPAHIERFQCM